MIFDVHHQSYDQIMSFFVPPTASRRRRSGRDGLRENDIQIANKNSQSTTALNHCVDCICLKQSRRLTRFEWKGGGSQILFLA